MTKSGQAVAHALELRSLDVLDRQRRITQVRVGDLGREGMDSGSGQVSGCHRPERMNAFGQCA